MPHSQEEMYLGAAVLRTVPETRQTMLRLPKLARFAHPRSDACGYQQICCKKEGQVITCSGITQDVPAVAIADGCHGPSKRGSTV